MPALLLITLCGLANADDPKVSYDNNTLDVKRMFSQLSLQALGKPFVGISENGKLQQGLFPIRATGVSTAPVVEAAAKFVSTLSPDQQVRTVFSVQDSEWRNWFNVDNGIFVRQGVSLKEFTPKQRSAAMDLMQASLSAKGLQLSMDIMKTDQTLREINNDALSFDEELYFFTMMGLPSVDEPWGWQIDGHHLVINYFVLDDQVVMTPVFLGGEPVVATSGKYAGNRILQQEQNAGLRMMRALGVKQQKSATLASIKVKNNNTAEANQDNLILPYQGARVAEFSDAQKKQLMELIDLFVGNMRDDQASIRMEEVATHLDDTRFAWVGEVSDEAVFYYRIHSPVILIEFDHQFPVGTRVLNNTRKPTRDHIHIVVRTPNGNDYGKDLLRQHLARHPH